MELIQPVAQIVRSIHEALETGQHMRARKLSEMGIEQYPDNKELCAIARILGPPRVIRTGIPPVGTGVVLEE